MARNVSWVRTAACAWVVVGILGCEPPDSGEKQSAEVDAEKTLPFDKFFLDQFESVLTESIQFPFQSGPGKVHTFGLDSGGTVYTFDNVYMYPDDKPDKEFCYKYGLEGNCVDKSKMLKKLTSERYLFNSIEEMFVGENYDFSLIIDPSGDLDTDRAFKGAQGQIREGTTKVALKMEAELTGPTFEIEPQGRTERELSVLSPTRWDWTVKPLAAGERPLQLSLYVVLMGPDGKKIGEDNPLVERRTILVDVTWIDWVADRAKQIEPIHALLVALATSAVGVLGWLGIRRKKPEDGADA